MSQQRYGYRSAGLIAVLFLIGNTVSGCARAGSAVDDIARQLAQQAGRSSSYSDEVARVLRGATASEDEALRLGQEILDSTATAQVAQSRIGQWIDDGLARLSGQEQAVVRQAALSATCEALDSWAQGENPDLGAIFIASVGSLSNVLDKYLLAAQLNDMWQQLQAGDLAAFRARVEILRACLWQ
jgi:hypothetical protein